MFARWTCLYPIYIDAKRPYGTGSRRISREKSVWWPLSQDIADATHRLQLNTIHEANKMHPKDWDNPGRVRVEWKRNGKLINPAIKSSARRV
jgi:signal recognition particle subunit SRP19